MTPLAERNILPGTYENLTGNESLLWEPSFLVVGFVLIFVIEGATKGRMKKSGCSPTPGYWDDKFETYFESCDEIWHAGDIGSLELASRLKR